MATKAPFYVAGTTPVYRADDGHGLFLAGADSDGDGIGGRIDGDKYYQPTTTYKPNLDSTKVRFFVVPGPVRQKFPGIVIGCRGQVTHVPTGKTLDFVVADEGPADKLGEMSIYGLQCFGIPSSPTNGGTIEPIFLYKFWPGVPALVDGVQYSLQPWKP